MNLLFYRMRHCLADHAAPLALLLLLSAGTYWEVLTHSFLTTWDDTFYITENPVVRAFTLGNIAAAFSTNYHGNYAPVQIISYMLDHAVWGMEPFGFLLTNVACHTVSGLLLYGLLLRQGFRVQGAMFGAALFLVHPVQVESVAWLSQRKNLLAMLFFLLAFHAWLYYRETAGVTAWRWYLVSLAAFIAALLSKSVAAIFPVMLLLYDVMHPVPAKGVRFHLDKIPPLVLALAVAALTVFLQSMSSGGGRVDYPPDALVVLPMTMLTVLTMYMRILFWPVPENLSAIYDPDFRTYFDADVALGAAVALVLLLAGIWLRRRSLQAFFWYCLFFLGLVPVSQVVPLITIINDRYLYFPMLGIAGIVSWAWGKMFLRLALPAARGIFVAALVGCVLLLATVSNLRGRVWKDTITLFADTLPKVGNRRQQWFMLADGFRAAGHERAAVISDERGMMPGPLDESDLIQLGRIFFELGEYQRVRSLSESLIKHKKWREVGLYLLAEYHALRRTR